MISYPNDIVVPGTNGRFNYGGLGCRAFKMKHHIERIKLYTYLLNPLIPRKNRACRSFGKDVLLSYNLLEKSQWWSRPELKNYQNEKVAKLIRHAYENIPYYRQLLKQHRLLPEDIKTAEDLAKIPVLTKRNIRENFPDKIAMPAKYSDLPLCTTGGSTGEPLKFFADACSDALAWASFFRFLSWAGYLWGDRVNGFWREVPKAAHRRFYVDWIGFLKKRYVPNIRHYNASKMNDAALAFYIEQIKRSKNFVLSGYVSALKHLARYIRNKGIEPLHPKFITTTAETLSEVDRELLINSFQCDVFDQYACTEIMGVANECPEHSGLHISSEHVVVEVVNEKEERVLDGEYGQLAITDLDNYTMPFIRYINGDLGRLLSRDCACGRSLPMMDYVGGRSVDVIRGPNGTIVHGLYFVTLLKEAGLYDGYNILDYEIVQKKTDVLDCNFVFGKKPSGEAVEAFRNACRDNLGQMQININFFKEIPKSASGKRRFIRSEINSIV